MASSPGGRHPAPRGRGFLTPSLEQASPKRIWRLPLQKGGYWREEAKCSWQAGPGDTLWPQPARVHGLTCSLLPAAGTVSVGASSCLSLSQHPSPTSAFRHHYVPYFRGKTRSGHVLCLCRRMACPVSHTPALALCLVRPAVPVAV